MAPLPPPTLLEKVGIVGILAKTMFLSLCHLLSSPIRTGPRAHSLFRDVLFRGVRYQLDALNLAQERYMNSTTEASYLGLAKNEGFQPDTLVLSDGSKAFWVGAKSADKVIVFFHGGGYVLPATPGHCKWLFDLTQHLSKKFSVSSILLGYTCSPEGQYPTQLCQAAELVHHLIEKEGKKPSDIIIAGDSAGGNLSLALLSHILHPHPDVPTKINLTEPLRAAVLISPWVSFDVNQASFHRNYQSDFLPQGNTRWSQAFLGTAKSDAYNEPVTADKSWFQGLAGAASEILVWGGGGEVLIDSIEVIQKKLKDANPKTDYVVEPGACHEQFLIDILLGYKEKGQGTKVIEEWISSKL
ncbi:hypothetical protein MBLNU459_g0987t1 [Dothideomycetes sp. NU459]